MPVNVNGVTLGNTFSAGSYEVPSMVVFVHTRAVLSAKRAPFLWGLSTGDGLYPPPFILPGRLTDTDACKHTHTPMHMYNQKDIRCATHQDIILHSCIIDQVVKMHMCRCTHYLSLSLHLVMRENFLSDYSSLSVFSYLCYCLSPIFNLSLSVFLFPPSPLFCWISDVSVMNAGQCWQHQSNLCAI